MPNVATTGSAQPHRFVGRKAIVTGAAQGLGRATAARLLEEGGEVVMVDRQENKVQAAAAEMAALHDGRASALAVDLSTPDGPYQMVEAAVATLGKLDILVNVAGGSGDELVREIEEVHEDLWQYVFATNVHATYRSCRAAVPHMRKAGYGRIVNFSSGATVGTTMWPTTIAARLAYVSAKGAIDTFSRQLALDLLPAGITVNVLVPGFVLTEPGARVYERFQLLPDELRKAFSDVDGPGATSPADIADGVAYLASEQAGHVNGIMLKVGC